MWTVVVILGLPLLFVVATTILVLKLAVGIVRLLFAFAFGLASLRTPRVTVKTPRGWRGVSYY